MGLNFKKNTSTLVKKSQLIYPAIVLGSVFAACTPEPARRSAVESSKLCSSDPDRSVWAGTCLATQASTAGVSGDSNGGRSPEAAPGGNNSPSPSGPKPDPVGGNPPSPSGPKPDPVGGNPPSPSGPKPAAGGDTDPAAQNAAVINEVTKAIKGATPAVVDGLGQVLNGGGAKPGTPAKTETKGVPSFVVTFSKDSFVGIADNSVIKNCFVSSGAVLEVKGEPKKITEFSSLGVSQYVTGETLDASLTGGSESCELKGKDFVFISGHASFAAKP